MRQAALVADHDSGTYVFTVVFSPNGKSLAAASTDALRAAMPELDLTRAWHLVPGPFTFVVPNPQRRFAWLTGTSPETLGGTSLRLLLLVDDPEAVFTRAVAAGADPVHPVQDSHGWRLGRVRVRA